MTKTFARKLVSTLVLSFAAIGAAHAASAATARDLLPGDKYGYEFRTHDTFTDGARSGKLDVFTEGALVAGLDRSGVSASPARSFDAYTDGARTGKLDVFTEGALVAGLDRSGVSASPARSFDAYTDGARSGKLDVFTEGANV